MSIASHAFAQAAVSEQAAAEPVKARKPPPKRSITAKPDTTEMPEPR